MRYIFFIFILVSSACKGQHVGTIPRLPDTTLKITDYYRITLNDSGISMIREHDFMQRGWEDGYPKIVLQWAIDSIYRRILQLEKRVDSLENTPWIKYWGRQSELYDWPQRVDAKP